MSLMRNTTNRAVKGSRAGAFAPAPAPKRRPAEPDFVRAAEQLRERDREAPQLLSGGAERSAVTWQQMAWVELEILGELPTRAGKAPHVWARGPRRLGLDAVELELIEEDRVSDDDPRKQPAGDVVVAPDDSGTTWYTPCRRWAPGTFERRQVAKPVKAAGRFVPPDDLAGHPLLGRPGWGPSTSKRREPAVENLMAALAALGVRVILGTTGGLLVLTAGGRAPDARGADLIERARPLILAHLKGETPYCAWPGHGNKPPEATTVASGAPICSPAAHAIEPHQGIVGTVASAVRSAIGR